MPGNGEAIEVPLDSLPSFKGKTVLITGASSGIGLSCAELFYELGANVAFVCGRKTPPTDIPLDSPRTLQTNVNIADWRALENVFAMTYKKFGTIDIVVPNAGVAETPGQFFNLQEDGNGGLKEMDLAAVDIDIKGTVFTIALGIHYLKKNAEGGSLILMSSMAGYEGVTVMPGYSAAKHAATGLLRSLPKTAANHKIAISLVAPSMTYTPGAFPGNYKPGKEAWEAKKAEFAKLGVPISSAYTCALATAYLAKKGLDVNGDALLVHGDEITDLESEFFKSRPDWFVKKASTRESAGKAFAQQTAELAQKK